MITPALSTTARFAARVSLPLVAVGLALLAVPAHADVAEGWSDPADVSALHALLLLGGVPVLLIALIALAVYLPALVRGEDVSPGGGTFENQWIGGPRHAKELAPSGDTESGGTGGAHGSW